MKKFGRKLAIVLVMMMIFTSFEFVGVFAGNETEGEPVVTEQPVGEDVVAPTEGAVTTNNDEATEPAPSLEAANRDGEEPPADPPEEPLEDPLEIKDLQLLAGYNCVVLRWKKIDVEGVEYYVDGQKVEVSDYDYVPGRLTGEYVMYKINKPVSEDTSLPEYEFTVQAKAGDAEGPEVVSNRRAPVRTIAYKFTVKKGTTLKKHGGNGPKTYKLKKGQTLICYGFGGGGCYMFKYKDSIFYCAKIRVKKPAAVYRAGGWNYWKEEAELFLSQKGVSSKTNVYLWCNQYTQHLYYMEKVNGRWKCTDSWECSTGKPSAPTPTGMYGIKKIEGKWKKHHNIKWWSKFSGTNSVHGQKPKWTFGRPKSNGCIRNPVAKAEKVYWGAKVGTGLLVY